MRNKQTENYLDLKPRKSDKISWSGEDGKVTLDRKVYEQKLGALMCCKTADEVLELANNATDYLSSHYHKEIIRPVKW